MDEYLTIFHKYALPPPPFYKMYRLQNGGGEKQSINELL